LRDKVLQALGDPESRVLLNAIRDTPKDSQTISREAGIPLSSVYRKLAALRESGLIMTSSFVVTPEGKRQDLLVAAVTEVRIAFRGEGVEVDLTPTQENANRIWFEMFTSRTPNK
jgi:DNA-binding transcriptional ArsR family regulator